MLRIHAYSCVFMRILNYVTKFYSQIEEQTWVVLAG